MWECQKCHERHEYSVDVCWNCGTDNEGVEDPTFPTFANEAENAVAPARTIEQLIYVGLNGYALALDRDTGEIAWSNNEMRSGYVHLLLDGDRLIVSTNGYMYCLDPLTGKTMWHNPLTGYGMGPTSLTSVRGPSSASLIQQAAASLQKNTGSMNLDSLT
jgi:outer membrane protein assembly factor BamB